MSLSFTTVTMLHNRTWLLIGRKMAKEASAQELKELEDILRSNPELHFSLQALSDLWQHQHITNPSELSNAYAAHIARMKAEGFDLHTNEEEANEPLPLSTSRSNRRRFAKLIALTVAAGILLWICLTPYIYNKPADTAPVNHDVPSEISTRNGSKTNIILPDSTRVWLNAGSKLTYDKSFGDASRNVVLTGEAYFDVTHNPSKPFIIHTRTMELKVLGTEFNVKSYPEDHITETSLIRGSIEVTLKDKRAEKIIMKPNEKLVIKDEPTPPLRKSVVSVGKAEPGQTIITLGRLNYFSRDSSILETSWVHNRLAFEDESFSELATRLERWYGVRFQFQDKAVANLRFTGSFQNETVSEALEAMRITARFNYSIQDKTITITN